jgi:hypothetical protein
MNDNAFLFLGLVFCFFLNSCSTHIPFYVDINKQAIVSCDGNGMKYISIEGDSMEIIVEGTPSILYFGKEIDASKVSIFDSVVYNYKIMLRPNSKYKASTRTGYDRGPFAISFSTDRSGFICQATITACKQ